MRPAVAAAAVSLAALTPLVPATPAPAQESRLAAPSPWLSAARVTARVADSAGGGGTAELRATYRFRPGTDTARLSAIRIEGVEVEVTSVGGVSAETAGGSGVRWRLDTLPGLLRVRVSPAPDSLTLAWRLRGADDRLPLFVPETPTRPAESRVLIEVRGGDFDLAAGRVFPRMERAGGRLVGRPENLPSFLLLSPSDEVLTVDRVADWSVVLLVLVATGWWTVWRWRAAKGRGAEAAPSRGRGADPRRSGKSPE